MSHATDTTATAWTAVDLVERFGAIPLHRVVQDPPPGNATEQDVIDLDDHEDRLCELVDGALVEKTVGAYESYLTVHLIELLGAYVRKHKLGIVLGEGGMMRLAPGWSAFPMFLSFPGTGYPATVCPTNRFSTCRRIWPWKSLASRTPARKWTANFRIISRPVRGWSGLSITVLGTRCGCTSNRKSFRWSMKVRRSMAATCCPVSD